MRLLFIKSLPILINPELAIIRNRTILTKSPISDHLRAYITKSGMQKGKEDVYGGNDFQGFFTRCKQYL